MLSIDHKYLGRGKANMRSRCPDNCTYYVDEGRNRTEGTTPWLTDASNSKSSALLRAKERNVPVFSYSPNAQSSLFRN